MSLIKNGKFFIAPDQTDEDFKALFARVAASGVGRPVDEDGCPQGPWTADLLAAAISELEPNREGIELRTVQLWFEDNDKGISANNIRWLARVLGCNDPEAASAWQAALSAAQTRLAARRRAQRKEETLAADQLTFVTQDVSSSTSPSTSSSSRVFELSRATEALFSRGSILNLPATVFAGAVALQFISYFLSIHNITYLRDDGVTKQVGFLWATNWTLLFVVFLPLFLVIIADRVTRWKSDDRAHLMTGLDDEDGVGTWISRVRASSYSFSAVLLICVGFAGVFQWLNVRLLPLLNGGGDYAIDWGSLALVEPDQISINEQIAFTGIAYLYMCLCFFLFFAGLILLSSLVDDFAQIKGVLVKRKAHDLLRDADAKGSQVLNAIVRCTIVGLLMAICMKLESLYRKNSAPDILDWLTADARAVLFRQVQPLTWEQFSSPTHYTSLLVAFLVCAVYLYAHIRIGSAGMARKAMFRKNLAVAALVAAYLMIGVIPGFSLLIGVALIVAFFGLFDPDFGLHWEQDERRPHVS